MDKGADWPWDLKQTSFNPLTRGHTHVVLLTWEVGHGYDLGKHLLETWNTNSTKVVWRASTYYLFGRACASPISISAWHLCDTLTLLTALVFMSLWLFWKFQDLVSGHRSAQIKVRLPPCLKRLKQKPGSTSHSLCGQPLQWKAQASIERSNKKHHLPSGNMFLCFCSVGNCRFFPRSQE